MDLKHIADIYFSRKNFISKFILIKTPSFQASFNLTKYNLKNDGRKLNFTAKNTAENLEIMPFDIENNFLPCVLF